MADLTGLIISGQTGVIRPPLFDAGYSVNASFCANSLGATNFARGSTRPLLYSFSREPINSNTFVRFNAALLGTSAATLYQGGNQTSATDDANGVTRYQACFFGNLLACSMPRLLEAMYFDAMPFGVGNNSFPGAIAYAPLNFNSWLTNCSQTFVYQSATGWNFGVFYTIPGGTPRVQGFGPVGLQTSGNIPNINQIPSYWVQIFTIGYFPNLGNVALGYYNVSGALNLIVFFYNNAFSTVSSYIVRLSDTDYQAAIATGLNSPSTLMKVQITSGGFLITIKTSFTKYGLTRSVAQFILAADGKRWAPILPAPVSATAANIINNFGDNANTDYHLDPEGVFWAVFRNPNLFVTNSFGANISPPITPPWQNIHLPSFSLSCYTPCDIVSPII